MQTTEPRPTSLLRVTAIFTAFLIGMIVLLIALVYIATEYFDLPFENSAMGVIIVMVAGMSTGTAWFNRERQAPSSARKWAAALAATVVTLIMQGTMIGLATLAEPQMLREIQNEKASVFAIVFAAVAVFDLLTIRIGLWMGIRSAVKLAEKQAASAG